MMNNANPRISVIVPIYNAEKYLEECITSILSQNFDSYEVVLVDDGSNDNSFNIMNRYADDPRIKIIRQENAGVSAARNTGIENCSGEYIMFVDADDRIAEEMLKTMYEATDSGECDLVISDVGTKHANKETYGEDLLKFLVYNEMWSPWAKLFKRSTMKSMFDSSITVAEDLWFCYQNVGNWKKYTYIPKKMYFYRDNSESVMRKEEINIKDLTVFEVLERIIKDDKVDDETRAFLKAYYVKTYYFISSKDVSDGEVLKEEEKYGKKVIQYYNDAARYGKITAKIFMQSRLTALYKLLRKIRI